MDFLDEAVVIGDWLFFTSRKIGRILTVSGSNYGFRIDAGPCSRIRLGIHSARTNHRWSDTLVSHVNLRYL